MTASTIFSLGVLVGGLLMWVWQPIRETLRDGRRATQPPPAARARIQEDQAIVVLFPRRDRVDNVVPLRRPERSASEVETGGAA